MLERFPYEENKMNVLEFTALKTGILWYASPFILLGVGLYQLFMSISCVHNQRKLVIYTLLEW